jgi:hypothetical protein
MANAEKRQRINSPRTLSGQIASPVAAAYPCHAETSEDRSILSFCQKNLGMVAVREDQNRQPKQSYTNLNKPKHRFWPPGGRGGRSSANVPTMNGPTHSAVNCGYLRLIKGFGPPGGWPSAKMPTGATRLSHSKVFQGFSSRFKPFSEKKDCLFFWQGGRHAMVWSSRNRAPIAPSLFSTSIFVSLGQPTSGYISLRQPILTPSFFWREASAWWPSARTFAPWFLCCSIRVHPCPSVV